MARFADAGIEGSDAGTSLKTMLQRLAAPTDSAATMIEQLGIRQEIPMGISLELQRLLRSCRINLEVWIRHPEMRRYRQSSDPMQCGAATVMMNSGTEGLQKYIDAANDQEAAQRLANSQMSDGSRAIEELKGLSGNRSDSDRRYTGTNCPEGSRTYYRTCQ